MIWCVEDDDSIREIVLYTLETTGFDARGFENSQTFLEALKEEQPTLIILDIMLPDANGVDLLQFLRKNKATQDVPIIMATAKGSEYDKIKSLDLGADDYLVKPFGMMEMVSRIKAVLRRYQPAKKQVEVIEYGDLSLNISERKLWLADETVKLTYKEFELLKTLLLSPNRVFTREELLQDIWGQDYFGETRTVDVHIRSLRQKLGESGQAIRTIRHVGYSWEENK